MVLTMRIICLVRKINMPLPRSKEGHECGVILMAEPKKEQFRRFLCLLERRQNIWINYRCEYSWRYSILFKLMFQIRTSYIYEHNSPLWKIQIIILTFTWWEGIASLASSWRTSVIGWCTSCKKKKRDIHDAHIQKEAENYIQEYCYDYYD